MPDGLSLRARRYEARAKECLRLASRATDPVVGIELFKLRQSYLDIAHTVRRLEREAVEAWRGHSAAEGLWNEFAAP
jgi:hypothetical protein